MQTTGIVRDKNTFVDTLVTVFTSCCCEKRTAIHSLFGACCKTRLDPSEPEFAAVADVFRQAYMGGHDGASQVAVFHDGRLVVDLVSGFLDDTEASRAFERDDLAHVFSSSKVLESLVVAMLVDRRLLSLDERVSFYWPEFAQGGKQDVTVSELARHAGGIAVLDAPLDVDELQHVRASFASLTRED